MYNPITPVNSYLNILLNVDQKGVSNIYRIMLGKNRDILDKTSEKWNEKADLDLNSFLMGKSSKHISNIDDIYFRYIQFRTIHRRFYTNNILCRIGIKDTEQCNLCKRENDSNEHMLIYWEISSQLWNDTERWIRNIGIDEYDLNTETKLLGELKGAY